MLERSVAESPSSAEYREELAFVYEGRAAQLCESGQLEKIAPIFRKLAKEFPERRARRWELLRQVAFRGSDEGVVENFRRLENAPETLVHFRELLGLDSTCSAPRLRWLSCWLPATLRGKGNLPGIVFASDMPWVRSTCGYGRTDAARDPRPFGRDLAGLPYTNGIGTHAFEGNTPADVVLDVAGHKFAAFKAQVGLLDNGSVQFQVLADGKVKQQTPVMRYGTVEPISVGVAGAKEVVLRVLNGGDGNNGDSAGWGCARFVQAGAEDPLEEPPAQLGSATDANAAFFLAEVHWRLDQKDLARRWYDKAAAWTDKNKPEAEKLRPYRAAAAQLLGITEEPPTAKGKPK
jgi:hypothetical protein